MSADGFSSTPPSQLTPFVYDPVKNPNPNSAKRKRNLPGNPDPDAEVIALSPKSLMATNRFVCEICTKGFQRDQNLQLHRRGHNLPWKLKQRNKQEDVRKKVYVCPEKTCVHHDPSRALGDLTGVKKHFSRKHGEKKWKCEKCSKMYAVQSDRKAHSKICGTREYKCNCGTVFSRKDSFITHRAFCDALTEESSRVMASSFPMVQTTTNLNFQNDLMMMNCGGGRIMNTLLRDVDEMKPRLPVWLNNPFENPAINSMFLGSSSSNENNGVILPSEMMQSWLSRSQETVETYTEVSQGLSLKEEEDNNIGKIELNPLYTNHDPPPPLPPMSATDLLQPASRSTNSGGFEAMNTSLYEVSGFGSLNQTRKDVGISNLSGEMMYGDGQMMMMAGLKQKTGEYEGNLTRDFLGVEEERRSFSFQHPCSMNDSSIGFSESHTDRVIK